MRSRTHAPLTASSLWVTIPIVTVPIEIVTR
jgi:hypothetical protein